MFTLKADLDTSPGVRTLCPTRWTTKFAALLAIILNYAALLELFRISFLEEKNSEMKARINGVRYQMLEFNFFYGLCLAKLILLHTDSLATSLQRKDLCASQGKEMYRITRRTLERIRAEDFDQFWEETLTKSQELEVNEPQLPRKKKMPAKFRAYFTSADSDANEKEFVENVRDHFKKIFHESFDLIIKCLEDRFEQDGQEMYSVLQSLILLAAQKKPYDEQFKKVIGFYQTDFDENILRAQLYTFSTMFEAKEDLVFEDIIDYFKQLRPCVRNLLSEVSKVVKLCQVFPASNASSERKFSKMRLINTYLRSTMKQKRLNHYMILGIYSELVDELDTAKIAEEFISRVDRRKATFGQRHLEPKMPLEVPKTFCESFTAIEQVP